jgi:UDP-N-acetylmuramate--alanine ligase
MRSLPLDIGVLHFVGIGGIGMSGIAEVLHNLGYDVQGSDLNENANVLRLRKLGIPVHIGHKAENLGDARVVVISSAVKPDNPEVKDARDRLIPVVRRAEMLAELMRLKWSVAVGGTHGKTTTTSMMASLFDAAEMDPTIINGGIINAYGTNARLGQGDWVVVEADESDGTFTKLPVTVAVVTNIDPEHLDFYGSFDKAREAFKTFVENVPFYGFAVLCIDHPEVQALLPKVSDRRLVTYGFSPQADVRCVNLSFDADGARFDVMINNRRSGETVTLEGMRIAMHGEHNVLNALATVAVGYQMRFEAEQIRKGLANFSGVKRRFTKTGVVNDVTIIDDYGHHPVEITAVLRAARQVAGDKQVIAVMQPHRYTRLQSLFEDFCLSFNDADRVLVADVYAAGEQPIEGFDKHGLVEGLRARGHRNAEPLESPDTLAPVIHSIAKPGDLVVCLGAGSISQWANALPAQLQTLAASGSD